MRWGPVSGTSKVPSLVDADGYFPLDTPTVATRTRRLPEVESELRAQIDRAKICGHSADPSSICTWRAWFVLGSFLTCIESCATNTNFPILLEAVRNSRSARGHLRPRRRGQHPARRSRWNRAWLSTRDWIGLVQEATYAAPARRLSGDRAPWPMTTKKCAARPGTIPTGAQPGGSVTWTW